MYLVFMFEYDFWTKPKQRIESQLMCGELQI